MRAEGDDDFEARLASIRRRSPVSKKAELKKSVKKDVESVSNESPKEELTLPPSPIEEPKSDGLVISLGFNPYSERLHGRLAILGLVALLSVELASGTGIFKYHDGSILGVQIYFILAATAVFVKVEKERKSIWPQ